VTYARNSAVTLNPDPRKEGLLDCGNQDEQDGEGETEAYGGGLGNLVRLEFRILCRDRHVADQRSRAAGTPLSARIPVT
jgi:hypothetical protein